MAQDAVEIGSKRARGLDRAFEILEFLRDRRRPMRPNEIAKEIGAPRSSIYELINVLLRNDMLEYSGDQGHVYLGRKLYYLGTAYAEHFDLMRECDGMLIHLAEDTRETAQMCLLQGNKYTVAMMREGVRPFRISANIGEFVPIPWTASGRLLVSHLSDEEIYNLIPSEDFVLPNGHRLDPEHFIAEARKAREDGYFTFNSIVDSFTHCLAVPVYQAGGDCIATLCLVAPREDGHRNRQDYLDTLTLSANELSQRLGYTIGRKRA